MINPALLHGLGFADVSQEIDPLTKRAKIALYTSLAIGSALMIALIIVLLAYEG